MVLVAVTMVRLEVLRVAGARGFGEAPVTPDPGAWRATTSRMISNGVVDTTSEQVKQWAPSFENYTFTKHGSSTELVVEMQLDDEHRAMFDDLWPNALTALKNLCEA